MFASGFSRFLSPYLGVSTLLYANSVLKTFTVIVLYETSIYILFIFSPYSRFASVQLKLKVLRVLAVDIVIAPDGPSIGDATVGFPFYLNSRISFNVLLKIHFWR
jgi:hypothetical protein